MESPFLRSLKISTIVHFIVVLLLIIAPLVFNRHLKKQRKEIVTFVDFTVALPETPPAVTPVRDIKPPEPPKPKEEPPKSAVPETVKPKPKIERSTNRVVRTPPKPAAPPLSAEEIKKLLAAGARVSDRTSIPTEIESGAWYYATVRQIMYDAWVQPGASVAAGTTAQVEVRVLRDGTVVRRSLTRPSGNSVMDQSVMRAVESVSKLPALPSAWSGPSRDITIEFVLER
jgi:TonB family protein